MLIDTHAHLSDERLLPIVDEIVSSMKKDGLSDIITVGYDNESSLSSVELAKKYDKVYCTVGIHPHDAKAWDKESETLIAAAADNPKCVAIGEIGLDYYYDLSPRDVQKNIFIKQLDMAYQLKMPTVIHLRDAYGDMLALLKDNKEKLAYGGLLHCYSGSKEMLKEFLKLDMFVSYGGAITFKNATEKPDILRATPTDRFVLETDCPYMTPVPYRGKTNLPKYVNLVADRVAEILNKDREEIDSLTTNNARAFFTRIK